jgi:hypothetical protein
MIKLKPVSVAPLERTLILISYPEDMQVPVFIPGEVVEYNGERICVWDERFNTALADILGGDFNPTHWMEIPEKTVDFF